LNFEDCFRVLCYTVGHEELHLISGKVNAVESVRLRKIQERIDLDNIHDGFFSQVDSIGTVSRDFCLGFFIFFDIEQGSVKIYLSGDVPKKSQWIERSQKYFCLANLVSSIRDQDLNRAESFCIGYNNMLKKNNLRQFHIRNYF